MSSNLKENKIVTFDSSKQFKFIRNLGRGGTGDTNLFLDENVNILFAIKKYSPSSGNDKDECYVRFIDEIKILFNIYHKNVVRIFNYYLYPTVKIGYIQMEYIDGDSIDKITPSDYGKTWNDYFVETINAFSYLCDNNILHRDIRPSNFMITKTGELKIIDFGFGKHIENIKDKNSVYLNWSATIHPEEVTLNQEYNYSTEIYYIGELFKRLVVEDESFVYNDIIAKMLEYSPDKRYSSYSDIKKDITNNLLTQISFTEDEKNKYLNFANALFNSIVKFNSTPLFKTNSDDIRIMLEKIVKVSSLEKYVQRNNDVISCFVDASFRYRTKETIKSETIIDFYSLFVNSDEIKKNIIINSIIARLQNIPVELIPEINTDNLPF